jgi:cell division protein ZapA (FtsZ GTPase activity inhibitor)
LEQLLTINLFGQPYTFKAETESGQPDEVANCLMDEVRKVESHQSGPHGELSKFKMLLVAALNIADEHVKLKNEMKVLTELVSDKSTHLKNRVDSSVRQFSGT